MKRSEFLKRLGLGAVAAVAAPALLAKEEKDYIEFDDVNDYIPTGRLDMRLEVSDSNDMPANVSNVRMQIKNNSHDIYLTEGSGLTIGSTDESVNYHNKITVDYEGIPSGDYDYELRTNKELIAKGKLKIGYED